jgi:hypothetical protein
MTLRNMAAFIACLMALAPAVAAAGDVPMLNCSGFPCVRVRIGYAQPIRLAIDTGDAQSVLNIDTAKALGLVIEPAKDKSGKAIDGIFVAQAKDVHIGDASLGDIKFLVLDLNKDIASGVFPRSDGSIAYTALKDKVLTLDYRSRAVTVADASSDAPCPGTCGAISYPTFGQKGPPIVVTTGFRVNGKDVSVQIDTLYSGTMLIYPTSVEKLGLSAEAGSAQVDHFPFTDGGVDMVRGKASDESFGTDALLSGAPLYFATPKVHLPDGMFDGTVGEGLFAGHVLTLDFRANRFRLE